MNEKEILSSTRRIHDLLSAKRVKEAMTDLRPMLADAGVNSWIEEVEQIDTTYRYMLDYTVKGVQDPDRQKVYRKIVADLYELSDRASEFLLTRLSTRFVHVQVPAILKQRSPLNLDVLRRCPLAFLIKQVAK